MLSRRNIRIKVMQLLYAKNRDPKLDLPKLRKRYTASINKSYELYLFSLLLFTKAAQYAQHDASKRTAKLLPSDDDKLFKASLAENDLLQSLVKNEELLRQYRAYKLDARVNLDTSRLIYTDFLKDPLYIDYLKKESHTFEDHKAILLALFKHCINNENYTDALDDHFFNWIDDKSLVVGAMKKTIKALPSEDSFFIDYQPDTETATDFGQRMLELVYQEDAEYLEIIEPILKNWDADRVAVVDMILLKMAVCELLIFTTIPTKVTLNEFVEISKVYSTDKSKDFINGILDRLMKKLQKDGKINKEGRGLIN